MTSPFEKREAHMTRIHLTSAALIAALSTPALTSAQIKAEVPTREAASCVASLGGQTQLDHRDAVSAPGVALTLFFDRNSGRIRPEHAQALRELAARVRSTPGAS